MLSKITPWFAHYRSSRRGVIVYRKLQNMNRIVASGIIAVVRVEGPAEARQVAEACKAGGIEA